MSDNLPSMLFNPEDQPLSTDAYIDSLEAKIKQLEAENQKLRETIEWVISELDLASRAFIREYHKLYDQVLKNDVFERIKRELQKALEGK